MDIKRISLAQRRGRVVAGARAAAPAAGAKIWIEVAFEPSGKEPWQEARDSVSAVLDVA